MVLALLSLVAWTEAAARPPEERTLRARRVVLSGATVDVRVAPGVPTTLNFDADLDPRSVALDDSVRVKLLSVAARAITLVPSTELDGPVTLRARFADAGLTLAPIFSLRADPAEVDAQVMLYRDTRTPELLLARMAELEARAAACEAELAARRDGASATGPAAMVLAGKLETGVRAKKGMCVTHAGTGALACEETWSYLAKEWVVVTIRLRNRSDQPAWKPGRLWLVGESNLERIEARAVSMAAEALEPGSTGTLAVEFPPPPQSPRQAWLLELQESDGARPSPIALITFDIADASAPKKDGP
nr:DUF2381 family protein [Pyxidicoccus fallax]